MRLWTFAVAGALATLLAVSGCGSKETESAAPGQAAPEDRRVATEVELYSIWDQLRAMPPNEVDLEMASGVARSLAQIDLEKLNPLLERMGEEDASVTTYYLPLRVMRDLLRVEHEPTLIALSQPGQPLRARRTSTELLSAIGTDSARERVVELMDDEDASIAASAVLARLPLDEEEAVSRVKALWDNDEVSPEAKQEIIRRIPESAAPAHRDLFIGALAQHDWDPTVRQRAIVILGSSTDQTAKAALEEAAESSPEPQLKDLAGKAVDAIDERIKAGLGDLQFNAQPDGTTGAKIELKSEPQAADPAKE